MEETRDSQKRPPVAFAWSARGSGSWESCRGDMAWLSHVVPADREALRSLGKAVLENGVAAAQFRLQGPDGRERWYLAHAKRDLSGADDRWFATAVDYDDHTRAARDEKERHQHARALLRLSQALDRVETRAEACRAAEDVLAAATAYRVLWIYLLAADMQHAELHYPHVPPKDPTCLRFSIADLPVLQDLLEADDLVIIEDALADSRTAKAVMGVRLRTAVHVPMLLPGRRLGIFGTGTFADEGVRLPSPAEQDFLRSLAGNLAAALRRIEAEKQHREAEKNLRLSEEMHREISENAEHVISLFEVLNDGSFRMLETNPAFERTFGLPRADFIGKRIEECVPAPALEHFRSRFHACTSTGTSIRDEVSVNTPAGLGTFRSTILPVRNGAGVVYRILVITQDTTEVSRAKGALRRLNRTLRTLSRGNAKGPRAYDKAQLAVLEEMAAELAYGDRRRARRAGPR